MLQLAGASPVRLPGLWNNSLKLNSYLNSISVCLIEHSKEQEYLQMLQPKSPDPHQGLEYIQENCNSSLWHECLCFKIVTCENKINLSKC